MLFRKFGLFITALCLCTAIITADAAKASVVMPFLGGGGSPNPPPAPAPAPAPPPESVLKLPNIVRTCLPEEGRMKPSFNWKTGKEYTGNDMPSCHCPPKSYCPRGISEWGTSPRMPGGHAIICCPPPSECNVSYSTGSGGCTDRVTVTPTPYCSAYQAILQPEPGCVGIPGLPANCSARDAVRATNQARLGSVNASNQATTKCFSDYVTSIAMTKDGWEDFKTCLSTASPNKGNQTIANCSDQTRLNICVTRRETCNDSGSDCLLGNAEVLMADGTSKRLDAIAVGDVVKGPQGKDGTVEKLLVTEWPYLTTYKINDGLLEVTVDHPVLTTNGWRAVDFSQSPHKDAYKLPEVPNLAVGDLLVTLDGEVPVTSIKAVESAPNAKSYNLQLKGSDVFYAGGVLVKGLLGK